MTSVLEFCFDTDLLQKNSKFPMAWLDSVSTAHLIHRDGFITSSYSYDLGIEMHG